MIRVLTRKGLQKYPKLRKTMFLDRASQFKSRLNWEVVVDEDGLETDRYDDADPVYMIYETSSGEHGGSMRFLSTAGPCLMNDYFPELVRGHELRDKNIWECTRLCLGQGCSTDTSAALLLGASEFIIGLRIRYIAGVFDTRMIRIYRMLGASPRVIGSIGTGADQLCVGLWSYSACAKLRLVRSRRVDPNFSQMHFERSFPNIDRHERSLLPYAM